MTAPEMTHEEMAAAIVMHLQDGDLDVDEVLAAEIQATIEAAVETEREACAKVAEAYPGRGDAGIVVAEAIRARGEDGA